MRNAHALLSHPVPLPVVAHKRKPFSGCQGLLLPASHHCQTSSIPTITWRIGISPFSLRYKLRLSLCSSREQSVCWWATAADDGSGCGVAGITLTLLHIWPVGCLWCCDFHFVRLPLTHTPPPRLLLTLCRPRILLMQLHLSFGAPHVWSRGGSCVACDMELIFDFIVSLSTA